MKKCEKKTSIKLQPLVTTSEPKMNNNILQKEKLSPREKSLIK